MVVSVRFALLFTIALMAVFVVRLSDTHGAEPLRYLLRVHGKQGLLQYLALVIYDERAEPGRYQPHLSMQNYWSVNKSPVS